MLQLRHVPFLLTPLSFILQYSLIFLNFVSQHGIIHLCSHRSHFGSRYPSRADAATQALFYMLSLPKQQDHNKAWIMSNALQYLAHPMQHGSAAASWLHSQLSMLMMAHVACGKQTRF